MVYIRSLIYSFLICSCAQLQTSKPTKDDTGVKVLIRDKQEDLPGSFTDESGDKVFLSELQDKPIVLMFVGVTCSTCIAETKEIINSFKKGSANSEVVNFVTVLVDHKRTDRWRLAFEDRQPEWLLGFETSGDLYFTYFPKESGDPEFPLTPAMVIYHPFRSELFLHKGTESLGEITIIEYIRSRIGLWES